MKKFNNVGIADQFVVTTESGRRIAAGLSIEHIESVAIAGRGRCIYKRRRDGAGYDFYRSF